MIETPHTMIAQIKRMTANVCPVLWMQSAPNNAANKTRNHHPEIVFADVAGSNVLREGAVMYLSENQSSARLRNFCAVILGGLDPELDGVLGVFDGVLPRV